MRKLSEMSIFTYFQNILASKKCTTCGTRWGNIKNCKFCDVALCGKCSTTHKTTHQCAQCEAFFQELHQCTKCPQHYCNDCWPNHPHVEKCAMCGIISSTLYRCKACQQYFCAKCLHDHPEEPIKIDNYRVRHTRHNGVQISLDKNVLTAEERRQRDLEDGFRR